MNFGPSTVDFGSVYGPAAGQAVASRVSESPGLPSGKMDLPLGFAALIALGLMAWWALEKWD